MQVDALELGHGGALHRLQPAPEVRATEGVAGPRDVKKLRLLQRLILEAFLDSGYCCPMRCFHNDVRPAGRAGEVAGLVKTANDVPRTVGQERLALVNDLAQPVVPNVFDALYGAIHALQIGANIRFAEFKRAIQLFSAESRAALPFHTSATDRSCILPSDFVTQFWQQKKASPRSPPPPRTSNRGKMAESRTGAGRHRRANGETT